MLRNEVGNEAAATAMETTAEESGLVNEYRQAFSDSAHSNKTNDWTDAVGAALLVGGAALAAAAAVKYGRPLLALGKSAQGELALKPATEALVENSIPISKATRSFMAGETTILGVERGGRVLPATEALIASSKPITAEARLAASQQLGGLGRDLRIPEGLTGQALEPHRRVSIAMDRVVRDTKAWLDTLPQSKMPKA